MTDKTKHNNTFIKIRESFIAEFVDIFGNVVEKLRNTPSSTSELDKYKCKDVDLDSLSLKFNTPSESKSLTNDLEKLS